jgi:hypothetical protein
MSSYPFGLIGIMLIVGIVLMYMWYKGRDNAKTLGIVEGDSLDTVIVSLLIMAVTFIVGGLSLFGCASSCPNVQEHTNAFETDSTYFNIFMFIISVTTLVLSLMGRFNKTVTTTYTEKKEIEASKFFKNWFTSLILISLVSASFAGYSLYEEFSKGLSARVVAIRADPVAVATRSQSEKIKELQSQLNSKSKADAEALNASKETISKLEKALEESKSQAAAQATSVSTLVSNQTATGGGGSMTAAEKSAIKKATAAAAKAEKASQEAAKAKALSDQLLSKIKQEQTSPMRRWSPMFSEFEF